MENQPMGSSAEPILANLAPTSQLAVSAETKTNSLGPIFFTLLVSALIFGFAGYYFGKIGPKSPNTVVDQSSTKSPTPSLKPTLTPTVSPTVDQAVDYSAWQSYTNQRALYEVSYPNGWRVVSQDTGEGYGPEEVGEDILWSINVYEKSKYTLEQIVAEFGKQFSDRKQTQQKVVINDLPAVKYVTTTPSMPAWILETILIENNSVYLVISNGAITNEGLQKMNGVPEGTTFEKFYTSFHFVN